MVEAGYTPQVDDKPFMILPPNGDNKQYSYDDIMDYVRSVKNNG